MKISLIVLVCLVFLVLVGWLGLKIRPRPFPAIFQPQPLLAKGP